MVKSPNFKKSFTPTIRKLNVLLATLKPSVTRKKRGRRTSAHSSSGQENRAPPPAPTGPSSSKPGSACVALQNEDPNEDAVVITTLNVIPFCCHADLVMMPRRHLLAVANTLNAKLPAAMQIDVSPLRSDAFIRNSIEILVGLKRTGPVPQAPKPVKSRLLPAHMAEDVLPSPGSPLAAKNRMTGIQGGAALNPPSRVGTEVLSVLKEDDEEFKVPVTRATSRKRKLETTIATTTIATPLAAPDFGPARRITRAQSHRVAPVYKQSQRSSARVLRARSQRLPGKTPDFYNHPNITVARGRRITSLRRASSTSTGTGTGIGTRADRGDDSDGIPVMSTPKRRKTFHHISPSPKSSRVSPRKGKGKATASSSHRARRAQRAPRRASAPVASQMDTTAEEVTFGIDGMSMAVSSSGSDMDLSSD